MSDHSDDEAQPEFGGSDDGVHARFEQTLRQMVELACQEAAVATPEQRERMMGAIVEFRWAEIVADLQGPQRGEQSMTEPFDEDQWRSFKGLVGETFDALKRQPRDALWFVQGAIERAEQQQVVAVDDESTVQWGQVVAALKGLREALL